MEEAERLCDRVAIIEYGKIIDIVRKNWWGGTAPLERWSW
jgi:hypothetical protein